MYVAVTRLDQVQIRFGRITPDTPSQLPVTLDGSRSRITATLHLSDTHHKLLPRSLQEGRLIAIIPCLFTQGINETQTLANTLGGTALQDEINLAGLETISKYFLSFKGLRAASSASSSDDRTGEATSRVRQICFRFWKERENPSLQITKLDRLWPSLFRGCGGRLKRPREIRRRTPRC